MKANYTRRTQSEEVRVANLLTQALKNNGFIEKSVLVDCMLSMLDKSANKAMWKTMIEYGLSGGTYADTIFAVRKVSDTMCQITSMRNPDTLETIFRI